MLNWWEKIAATRETDNHSIDQWNYSWPHFATVLCPILSILPPTSLVITPLSMCCSRKFTRLSLRSDAVFVGNDFPSPGIHQWTVTTLLFLECILRACGGVLAQKQLFLSTTEGRSCEASACQVLSYGSKCGNRPDLKDINIKREEICKSLQNSGGGLPSKMAKYIT